jgi:hypothetical protein
MNAENNRPNEAWNKKIASFCSLRIPKTVLNGIRTEAYPIDISEYMPRQKSGKLPRRFKPGAFLSLWYCPLRKSSLKMLPSLKKIAIMRTKKTTLTPPRAGKAQL